MQNYISLHQNNFGFKMRARLCQVGQENSYAFYSLQGAMLF